MIDTTNQYLTRIVPATLADLNRDYCVADDSHFETSLKDVLQKMDDSEFNLFLARVVIKASGQGITGFTLTGGVAWLKELKAR